MDEHHASIARRTLEEIHLKKAAERMNKASSSSDMETLNQYGMQRSGSGDGIMEVEKARSHNIKRRGQHLLTSPQVLDSIRRAKILPIDTDLELGSGTGNLTIRLLECARKVIAVEIDDRMVDSLWNRVAKLGLEDKLVIITGNALKMELPHFDLCVSNIPYGISSPLIAKIFLSSYKHCFRSATLLLQKEFAVVFFLSQESQISTG